MADNGQQISDITHSLTAAAEARFGKERTAELRTEIEQMATQLSKLYAHAVEFEDEP